MTPLSILLADDEADIRQLIMRWLEGEGYYVACAADGAEAAAILAAKSFDLVITDMLMPERDGVQFIAEIKQTRPGTRVLAMSGGGRVLNGADCVRMAQALGAHAAVMKPFTRVEFLAAVAQAIGTRPDPESTAQPAPQSVMSRIFRRAKP